MAKPTTYRLHIACSIREEAERLAKEDGTSLDQFLATAVAEKVAARSTVKFFLERKGKADWAAFDRLMSRGGGEEPRPGDEVPERRGL